MRDMDSGPEGSRRHWRKRSDGQPDQSFDTARWVEATLKAAVVPKGAALPKKGHPDHPDFLFSAPEDPQMRRDLLAALRQRSPADFKLLHVRERAIRALSGHLYEPEVVRAFVDEVMLDKNLASSGSPGRLALMFLRTSAYSPFPTDYGWYPPEDASNPGSHAQTARPSADVPISSPDKFDFSPSEVRRGLKQLHHLIWQAEPDPALPFMMFSLAASRVDEARVFLQAVASNKPLRLPLAQPGETNIYERDIGELALRLTAFATIAFASLPAVVYLGYRYFRHMRPNRSSERCIDHPAVSRLAKRALELFP